MNNKGRQTMDWNAYLALKKERAMESIQRIVIELETEADPSTLLDAAIEFGQRLAEEHGGRFVDDCAWVDEGFDPAEVMAVLIDTHNKEGNDNDK
jgi:hypothetical protein